METQTEQKETIEQAINRIANTNTSTEQDEKIIKAMLNILGFNKAVIITGIVYLTGYGHPQSIHAVARQLLKAIEKQKNEVKIL